MSFTNPGTGRPKAAPPPVAGAELDARRSQRLFTVEQLRHSRTPLQVIEVARHADTVADEGAPARQPPPRSGGRGAQEATGFAGFLISAASLR
jgi:hypothetical protein